MMGFSLSHCLGGGGEAPAEQFPSRDAAGAGTCRPGYRKREPHREGARETAIGLLSSPKYGSYRAAQ